MNLLKPDPIYRNGYKDPKRMKCSINDCDKTHKAKGYCSKHYQRLRATGSVTLKVKEHTCKADDCNKDNTDKGYCRHHYYKSITRGLDAEYRIVNDDKKRLKTYSKIDENGCWRWQNSTWEGYGKIMLNGRSESAHRASWKVFKGDIPSGMQINHKCHVRDCINPDHLYTGTQLENMRDMRLAGRENILRGSQIGLSKLKESDIIKIRENLVEGIPRADIAKEFKVSLSTINQIIYRKTWKHVE